ncbi:hypothetical protein V6N13_050924 [Hibiscus sabdariffa]
MKNGGEKRRVFEREKRRRQVITIYVNNIADRLHWKGLWLAFGRHGEVLDTFIANKRNKEGKRFGFVRTSNKSDANRMIERLNNFNLFGSKITVSYARFQTRQTFWRRLDPRETRNWDKDDKNNTRFAKGESSIPGTKEAYINKEGLKQVEGDENYEDMEKKRLKFFRHVEEEALWNLKNCLVGDTPNICSIESVRSRLHEWGMGEIKVKRLGGRSFILIIEDMELYMMHEDLQWSYLKEPWGEFEAFGENLNCNIDCEKMRVLIVTEQVHKISEVVDLEVGNLVYEIKIIEVGFTDNSSKKTEPVKTTTPRKANCSDASSSSESLSPMVRDFQQSWGKEAALIVGNLEKLSNHGKSEIRLGTKNLQDNEK